MDSPFNDTDRGAVLVGFLAIMKGYSNKEIGRELGLTRETVKRYLKHMFRKLDVRTRAEAVARAQAHGKLMSNRRDMLVAVCVLL